jgi:lysophospholipase-2
MSKHNPTTYIISPSTSHTHTLILLHGRGSSALTFSSELFESQDSLDLHFPTIFPSVKFVFPEARKRWAHVDEEDMHQWFDMTSVQWPWEDVDVQEKGLRESAEELERVIRREVEEVGWENVVVGGMSQGCAIEMYTLITKGIRVAGFVGMAGWLPVMEEEESDLGYMPVLLQHCKDDGVVPVENGLDMAGRLRKMGLQVKWECFEEGGHWLNEPEGMDGIVRFIRGIIDKSETAKD